MNSRAPVPLLIADPLDESSGEHGENQIRREEAELNQHDFPVFQLENRLEMRHQDIVQAG
jgi:hypothetical protein